VTGCARRWRRWDGRERPRRRHIYFFGIELELARDRDGRHREGFVSSTRSTFFIAIPAGLGQQFSTAWTGAIITHFGSIPLTACATMRAIGCLPSRAALRSLVTISAAAPSLVPGVAGRHRAVFLECRLQFRQRFHRRILARRFVVLDHQRLAFFLRNLDGKNLRLKETGFARTHRLLMAFGGEAILLSRLMPYFSATSSPVMPM